MTVDNDKFIFYATARFNDGWFPIIEKIAF